VIPPSHTGCRPRPLAAAHRSPTSSSTHSQSRPHTARVASHAEISYPYEPRLTLKCDTASLSRIQGTLEELMRKPACTPELSGHFNITDGTPLAWIELTSVPASDVPIVHVRSQSAVT